jgi:radical SAM protein with 4Fe4S-binding SPASM domain
VVEAVSAAVSQPAARPAPRQAARVGTLRRIKRALRPEKPFACQKPWTDLHNFSVDGRVDVCCIATGPSQTRYQLGNLNTDSFQDVWNGPAAREFRRTVNSDKPLPPCERCPMLRSFQGLWFDPIHTRYYVERRTIDYIDGKDVDSPNASPIARMLARAMGKFAMSFFRVY